MKKKKQIIIINNVCFEHFMQIRELSIFNKINEHEFHLVTEAAQVRDWNILFIIYHTTKC